jgi:hypothetical protein
MKFPLRRVALTSLALGVCSTGLAQETVPIEYYRPLRNSVSVGVRMIGGNTKVGFRNLGGFDSISRRFGLGAGNYDNGDWSTDERRSIANGDNRSFIDSPTTTEAAYFTENGGSRRSETTSAGTTVTWIEREVLAHNRYRLISREQYTVAAGGDSSQNYDRTRTLGDYVDYFTTIHAGATRNWGFTSPSQISSDGTNTYVDMSHYSTVGAGSATEAESSKSTGVEIQFAYVFKRYKHFEWGINFSAGSSTISASTNQAVRARLLKETDRFRVFGTDASGNAVTPSTFTYSGYRSPNTTSVTGTIFTAPGGLAPTDTSNPYLVENSLFLDHANVQSLGLSEAGLVDVWGDWRIKGAYYLLRVGPTARITLNKNWTLSVGAGFAGAYAGTRFTVDEFYERSDVAGLIRYQDESEEKRFVPGYYGDITLERWLSVRTGFYFGYGYEKLGDYTQHLESRAAKVDLGTSDGFRFGIITRF